MRNHSHESTTEKAGESAGGTERDDGMEETTMGGTDGSFDLVRHIGGAQGSECNGDSESRLPDDKKQ